MDTKSLSKIIFSVTVSSVLICGTVLAEAEFDFEELMESVDDNTHNLQGSIAMQDAAGTITLAKNVLDQFKLVEGFFARRGNAPDAVTDAKRYQALAAEIIKATEANNFQVASDKAIEMGQSCDQACYDTYKPL
jgi:hypothetical protein